MKIIGNVRKRTVINLTALIDVLFLLIIFFAVTTRFVNQKAIGIRLPEAKKSGAITTASKLVILMSQQDRLFFDGKEFTWDEAKKELKENKYDRSKKVILNIDRSVPHGKVIHLLDMLKLAKFTKVAFGTHDNP